MALGGYLPRYFKWSAKQTARAMFYFSLVDVPLLALLLIQCDDTALAGLNVPYAMQPLPNMSIWQGCQPACGCDTLSYNPICDTSTGVTFFSPCAAGCLSLVKTGDYTNCSCVPDSGDASGMLAQLTTGKCKAECKTMPVFLFLLFAAMMMLLINTVPITQVSACLPSILHLQISCGGLGPPAVCGTRAPQLWSRPSLFPQSDPRGYSRPHLRWHPYGQCLRTMADAVQWRSWLLL